MTNCELLITDLMNKNGSSALRSIFVTIFSFLFFLFSQVSFSQVTSSIDSTSIKIGEQIRYKIQVEADTTDLVVFPEGQTFLPLEMVEASIADTTKSQSKYKLIREYALTQFDSGAYTIPPQKVVIGAKTFLTDSLKVEVNNIVIDTTKQGLYDIKPLISVDKTASNWWKYILYFLLFLVALTGILYWLIWRKKPATEEERIALLTPYERAKLSLQKLDKSNYLENQELKDYYSELTGIIRTYLDEKVYDHALESTTDELVDRLRLLKDGNQIKLSKDDINNIETILKRADLVKFAKSKPDVALAEIDRKTIDLEIDQVKDALPEPTEEEKLRDQQYREAQERKKKRRKIIITSVVALLVIIGSLIGLTAYYGFNTLKDNILGHPSKELLEGEWVTSEYGAPGITISTPKVLKRLELPLPKDALEQMDMATFAYGSKLDDFSVVVSSVVYKKQDSVDIESVVEGAIKVIENEGVRNMVVQNDKFVTPNGGEGLKTYGSGEYPTITGNDFKLGRYIMLHFVSKNVMQQAIVAWRDDDQYGKQMADRIINSIEVTKKEQKPKDQS